VRWGHRLVVHSLPRASNIARGRLRGEAGEGGRKKHCTLRHLAERELSARAVVEWQVKWRLLKYGTPTLSDSIHSVATPPRVRFNGLR
jgi:hypothetical protein